MPLHPTVLWAQRADLIYLTVEVSDIKNQTIDLTENKLVFKGIGEKEENEYEAEIEFCKQVDPEKSKKHLTPRNLTMIIYKKEDGYWPRLQNGHKLNFVKVDFQRWRDEDEEDEEEPADPMGGLDFSSLMQQAGESQLPSMDHLEGDDSDEEEEEEGEDAKKD